MYFIANDLHSLLPMVLYSTPKFKVYKRQCQTDIGEGNREKENETPWALRHDAFFQNIFEGKVLGEKIKGATKTLLP